MNYKPLPKELTISESTIEGLGLFTKSPVAKDHILGLSHIKIEGDMVRTPLGGFYNHSDNPNCVKEDMGNEMYLKSLRDIDPGEEITVAYTMYSIKGKQL